jgi:hypothetical protein
MAKTIRKQGKRRKPRKPKSRYKSRKNIKNLKRKSKLLRSSRAGMNMNTYFSAAELAAREREQKRQNPRLTKPRDPGTPQKTLADVDYLDEIYLCKEHCDKIMNPSYSGGPRGTCDYVNIRSAYQAQTGNERPDVYDMISKEEGIFNDICGTCYNRGDKTRGDTTNKECIRIDDIIFCISEKCQGTSYPSLFNLCGACEVCV